MKIATFFLIFAASTTLWAQDVSSGDSPASRTSPATVTGTVGMKPTGTMTISGTTTETNGTVGSGLDTAAPSPAPSASGNDATGVGETR